MMRNGRLLGDRFSVVVGVLVVGLVMLGTIVTPQLALAQTLYMCCTNACTDMCPVEVGGGSPPRGPGCGNNCHERLDSISFDDSVNLAPGDACLTDLQMLFPSRKLQAGDEITVMYVREWPDTDSDLMQPLTADGVPAMYPIKIDDAANTTISSCAEGSNIVGGNYAILAVPQAIESVERFWEAIESEQTGSLTYHIDDLVSLDTEALQVNDHAWSIDIPVDVAEPGLTTEDAVSLQLNAQGQVVENAFAELLSDEGIVRIYAPGERFIRDYIEPYAPGFADAVRANNPYFTTGEEFSLDVVTNDVLESVESVVIQ